MAASKSEDQELVIKKRPVKVDYETPYERHQERPQEKIPMHNKGYNNIRQTGLGENDQMRYPGRLDESPSPFLEGNKTLAGVTKLIPIEVFDNRGALEQHDNDHLTLSKIQNMNKRPPSNRQKHNPDDSLDVLN